MSIYNWIMDIHNYTYTISDGYFHDSIIDIDYSIYNDYIMIIRIYNDFCVYL